MTNRHSFCIQSLSSLFGRRDLTKRSFFKQKSSGKMSPPQGRNASRRRLGVRPSAPTPDQLGTMKNHRNAIGDIASGVGRKTHFVSNDWETSAKEWMHITSKYQGFEEKETSDELCQREEDILRAAKKKSVSARTRTSRPTVLPPSPKDAFSAPVSKRTYRKLVSPPKDISAYYKDAYANFSVSTEKLSNEGVERDSFKVSTTEYTDPEDVTYFSNQPTTPNSYSNPIIIETTEKEEVTKKPKKQRKGFFSFFGNGGKKDKNIYSNAKKEKSSGPFRSRKKEPSMQLIEKNSSAQYSDDNGHASIAKESSENYSLISDMTVPTVFKAELTTTPVSLTETEADVGPIASTEKLSQPGRIIQKYGSFEDAKLILLSQPPPPPPPPRVSKYEQRRDLEIPTIQHDITSSYSDKGNGVEKMTSYMAYQQKLERSLQKPTPSETQDVAFVPSVKATNYSSVTSDVRVIRSILRRPRRHLPLADPLQPPTEPAFTKYDEKSITDPMQRAGMRLLSAAIIPIQTEVRRFLAMRRALTRMWALIVIQTHARRWIARKHYENDIKSIVTVQAVVRGRNVREDLAFNHMCASEIQRVVRGYQATMRVYEDIYKVTMVQSWVRMRIAMERAKAPKHNAATVIQSEWRRYKMRPYLKNAYAARTIQSAWRGFSLYADYMFLIADVVVVQKLARRWLAKRATARLREEWDAKIKTILYAGSLVSEQEIDAVQKIQSFVRGGQVRKAYTSFLAARRIQSIWRCKRLSNAYKYYRAALKIQTRFRVVKAKQVVLEQRGEILAATLIQSAWRGFMGYSDYIFTISDIITIQKLARRYIARKKYADAIEANFADKRLVIRSRVKIQALGRRFLARQRYWYTLGCVVQLQSWMRGRLAVLQLHREDRARLKLQCFARRCLGRQELLQRKFIYMIINTATKQRSKRLSVRVTNDEMQGYHSLLLEAKKQRRLKKKKNVDPAKKIEDDFLEDAFATSMGSNMENFLDDKSRIRSHSEYRSKQHGKRSSSSTSRKSQGWERDGSKNNLKSGGLPNYDVSVLSAFRAVTSSTVNVHRVPPPRMRKINSWERDEDLELEEAFIDAEIFTAKQRRKVDSSI